MAEGEAKIKLTADEAALVQSFRRALKKVGDDGATEMRKITKEVDKAGNSLIEKAGKALITFGAIRATLGAISREVSTGLAASADRNRAAGQNRITAELGIGNLRNQKRTPAQNLELIRNASGARSQEERAGFAAKASNKFSEQGFISAFLSFNTGVVSEDEALNAARRGPAAQRRLSLEAQRRIAAASPEFRAELSTRRAEAQAQRRVIEAGESTGRAARLGAAQRQVFEAENPVAGAVVSIARSVGDRLIPGAADAGIDATLAAGKVPGKPPTAAPTQPQGVAEQVFVGNEKPAEALYRLLRGRPNLSAAQDR